MDSQSQAQYDVFICHASEDKAMVARPLAQGLRSRGLRVWFDEWQFKVGDRLLERIDAGLSRSSFGVVILSPSFFLQGKYWTRTELDALVQMEVGGKKVILPVWHEIDAEEVAKHSPILASRYSSRSTDGIDRVSDLIVEAVDPDSTRDPWGRFASLRYLRSRGFREDALHPKLISDFLMDLRYSTLKCGMSGDSYDFYVVKINAALKENEQSVRVVYDDYHEPKFVFDGEMTGPQRTLRYLQATDLLDDLKSAGANDDMIAKLRDLIFETKEIRPGYTITRMRE